MQSGLYFTVKMNAQLGQNDRLLLESHYRSLYTFLSTVFLTSLARYCLCIAKISTEFTHFPYVCLIEKEL